VVPPVARRRGAAGARIVAALKSGFYAGFLPGGLVFVVYFVLHRALDMPWVKMATAIAIYAPLVGVSLALAVEGAVLLADAIAHRVRWLVPLANAPVFAGIAAAIAGIAPGAIGCVVFGGYRGPFVGTALIAIGTSSGALLVAIPAARRARLVRAGRAEAQRGDKRAIALALLVATLALGIAAAVVAPLLVDGAFVHVAATIDEHTALVGGVVGALGGAVLGIYNGLAIALARVRAV
jgi:hypothetical protein